MNRFVLIAVTFALTLSVKAQNTTLGQFTLGTSATCPPAQNSPNSEFAKGMSCFVENTVSCPDSENISLSFGYLMPSGVPLGVIVLLPGAGGENASQEQEAKFATKYAAAGYEVVQLQWDSAWEDATSGNLESLYSPNVQAAACRPATFLSYVYSAYYLPLEAQQATAGMCAQGFSAGSGALGYALAWYGAGTSAEYHLDKVALLSGPVFSDIDQGCENPIPPPQTVCEGNPSFCQMGDQAPWDGPVNYLGAPLKSMRAWTGKKSCGGAAVTTPAVDSDWLSQSIVNLPATPTFQYPDTVVTSWLCASGVMNNSVGQGWIFDEQVAALNPSFSLYAVQNCPVAEAVYGATATVPALGNESGMTAILNDMTDQSSSNRCTKH
jgi:hypothetical protein